LPAHRKRSHSQPGSTLPRLLSFGALLLALALALAACGDDDAADQDDAADATQEPGDSEDGDGSDGSDDETSSGYYEGEEITMLIGWGPGGGNDAYSRLLGPHLAEALGATVVYEQMPGSSGMLANNEIANVRPADGLTIGMMAGTGTVPAEALGTPGLAFDVVEDVAYVGRIAAGASVIVAGEHTGYESLEDVIEAGEFRMGGTGPTSISVANARALQGALGFEEDIVTGYDGSEDVQLAIARGELDGFSTGYENVLDEIERGELVPILMTTEERHPDAPDIPALDDVADLLDQQGEEVLRTLARLSELTRIFMARAGMPDEALVELRDGFMEAVTSEALLEEAAAQERAVEPMHGDDLQDLVELTLRELPDAYIETLGEE
jgi:tripartite-type tricarboxylate transporter receptor subunit TctC